MKSSRRNRLIALPLVLMSVSVTVSADDDQGALLPKLPSSSLLIGSTVPANGDLNPYGVAFVPSGFPKGGRISAGDVLVSNFNSNSNLQGTGSTIVAIGTNGRQSLFFQGSAGLGLTTALGVLRQGLVLVGNVPTTDGTCNTVKQGSLLVLDRTGRQIANLARSKLLNGPWDLTVNDEGSHVNVFVSNVLSGTITRLDLEISEDGDLRIAQTVQIASGYVHRCDPAAVVVGPTGLAYDADKRVLYVASTGDNAVYAVPDAAETRDDDGKGSLVYKDNAHLRGPLGLVLAPNGDLIAANGDALNSDPKHPSEMIEFTPSGRFVAQLSIDTGGQGGAFGIALINQQQGLRFAAVDDITNTVKIWSVRSQERD